MITQQQQIYLQLAGVDIEDLIDINYIKQQAIKAALYDLNSTADNDLCQLLDGPDEAWQEIAQGAQLKMTFITTMINSIEISREDIVTSGDLCSYTTDELVDLLAGARMTTEEKTAYWEDNLL